MKCESKVAIITGAAGKGMGRSIAISASLALVAVGIQNPWTNWRPPKLWKMYSVSCPFVLPYTIGVARHVPATMGKNHWHHFAPK
jgi:hypothetical protein